MEYAQIVFYQLVIFVIYGAIGVAAVKGGILDEAGLHAVSRVVIKVTLPVMLFTNTVSGVTRESLLESLPVTGATAVMYLLLALLGGWTGTLFGSVFVGFANGAGIPYIMSEASMKAGKAAATTVMPLISADSKRKSRVKLLYRLTPLFVL